MPEPSSREPRPSTGSREERYGGYTPGKNSSDLRRPQGLRNPPPSRPSQPSSSTPTNQTSGPHESQGS